MMDPNSQLQTSNATVQDSEKPAPQQQQAAAGPPPAKKQKNGRRPFNRSQPFNGKRAPARFEKQKETSLTFTYPLLTYFSYHTCFLGATILPGILYDIIQARDSKMTNMFSKYDLQYVTLLSAYLRTAQIVHGTKTNIIHGLSIMRDSVSNLLLPDVLCQYLETIGIVKHCSGIQLVPHFDTYRCLKLQSDFIDAFDYLNTEDKRGCMEGWPINDKVILRVQKGLSRALKGVFELRKVKDELEGTEAFLSAYVECENDRILPRSCQPIDVNLCKLGACFRFRGEDETLYTGLKLPHVHEAPLVQSEEYLTTWVLKQLKQGPISS